MEIERPRPSGALRKRLADDPWETIAHVALALTACGASLWLAPSLRGLFGGLLAVLMLAIAVVDARRFLIPNRLVLAAGILGLADAAMSGGQFALEPIVIPALRGLAVGGAFLILRESYRFFRGRDGIGLGDVKLAAVAGLWLDWVPLAFAVQVAALAALAIIALRLARGHRVSRTTVVPFGLFLAPAVWIGWMFQTMMY